MRLGKYALARPKPAMNYTYESLSRIQVADLDPVPDPHWIRIFSGSAPDPGSDLVDSRIHLARIWTDLV